jgi:hypothetical protein
MRVAIIVGTVTGSTASATASATTVPPDTDTSVNSFTWSLVAPVPTPTLNPTPVTTAPSRPRATTAENVPQPKLVSLTVTVGGKGSVSRRPSGKVKSAQRTTLGTVNTIFSYTPGAKVTLVAKAKAGWRFGKWQGACSGKKLGCVVKLTRSQTVTASFIQLKVMKPKTK